MEMSFSEALIHLRENHTLYRKPWESTGLWIKAQFPDENSKMGRPYLYIKNIRGELVPWLPSQEDLFAFDWCIKEKD